MSENIPKRVYLDQNAWIALAREHYGKDESHKLEKALKALRREVGSGRVVVPLSFNHLIEVCASGDMERRQRLARFMIDLSKCSAIAPFPMIRGHEALEAALRRLGVTAPAFNRELLVQTGLWHAVGIVPCVSGGDPGAAQLMEDHLKSDETAARLLSEWMSQESGRKLREETEQEADLLDGIRCAELGSASPDERRQFTTIAVAKEFLLPIAYAALEALGAGPSQLAGVVRSDADIVAFLHDVPTFDVFVQLMLARDEELGRAIHRNDLRDLGFLAAAIPYCDVVIAERYFAALSRKLGLDSQYGTRIGDAASLEHVLTTL